jgi:D-alanine transaminase
MSLAFFNGEFLPQNEVRVSAMDRGFLFGDGIYEVIPTYDGRIVGPNLHLKRLRDGLDALQIANPRTDDAWLALFADLLERNGGGNRAIYLQVTRGPAAKRSHRFPDNPTPTCFAYTFALDEPSNGEPHTATLWRVTTGHDLRWQRRQIKSIALLGNVMHMMEAVSEGADEILLFNDQNQLTEAAACNVFVVKNGAVATPPLDNEKLPGVTRQLMLDMMYAEGDWQIEERIVTRDEVEQADELWLSSSTKEIEPIVSIDGKTIGDGQPGPVWQRAQRLFHRRRFDFG